MLSQAQILRGGRSRMRSEAQILRGGRAVHEADVVRDGAAEVAAA